MEAAAARANTMPSEPRAAELVAWYDRMARILPWRVSPAARRAGVRPDPYRVWLSEVMLQQTTVAAAGPYFTRFLARWPRVENLAAEEDGAVMAAWAGLGYYARARNLLACASVVASEHGGRFPDTEEALLRLPGVGRYTAAVIAAIAFERSAVVVDGNVERVMARLYDVETPLPAVKPELYAHAARLTPAMRAGDYAQGVMDLGATVCTPRRPACGLCPWMAVCRGRLSGAPERLPRRAEKRAKPVRHGTAYLAQRSDGAVLLVRRPPGGLLGGMLALPGTDWTESTPTPRLPFAASWRVVEGEVRHTFTHFHLRLRVEAARVPAELAPEAGAFHPWSPDLEAALPTVMRKALRLGIAALEQPD